LIAFKTKTRARVKAKGDNMNSLNIDEVNVADDAEIKTKALNVNDDSVKDRWSRYIGAMGIEAVQ